MEKPFTIKVNDLHKNIIKELNEANMPCYVLKTILLEIFKEIEDADGLEITKYFKENSQKDKEQGQEDNKNI